MPLRPRWGRLYLTLIAVAGVGAATHVLVHHPVLVHVMDTGFALLLFAVLAGWVRVNRMALARLDEPVAGSGRPSMRLIQSRPSRRVRLEPKEHVVIPYDFR